jgi:hypothetical protein
MVSNFLVIDLTNNNINVFFYDERAQGKDVDALFSLQFTYHLEKFKMLLSRKIGMPKILLVILNNCVIQNKLQLVMEFFALLSILFYSKVMLVYLIPRHSHNIANRVIAWCCNVMKGKNLYSPMVIVEAVNEVKGVNVSFIDHCDAWRPCYVGWGPILKKHFKLLLVRYTFNYFFEFDEGHVNMQSMCSTSNSEAVNVPLVNATNISLIHQSFLSDLFNVATIIIEQAAFLPIRLSIAPMLSLTRKKLISLGKKYFLIPFEHLSYYPKILGALHATNRSRWP